MRAGGLGGLLTLFTVLFLKNPEAVRSSDLPPLSNVTVMCDSYGVVVKWESSRQQQFKLMLKPEEAGRNPIYTRDTQYNISEYLLDPAFKSYLVTVQREDGKYAESDPFTYNYNMNFKDIILCNLTFPPVKLIPGDYQLTVKFRNPFHVYRDTPALRQLQSKENLDFFICMKNSNASQDSCKEYSCTQDPDTCEGTMPFPEEQKEYCVTVYGVIRQTNIASHSICYTGSLKPSVPITVYIVPVCVILGIVLICVFMMFLAKKINKIVKEKIQSNLPDFLEETSYTHPFITLRLGTEQVEKNPLVEPVTIIPIIPDLADNSSQPWGSRGHLIDFGDDPGKTSVAGEQEAEAVVEAAGHEDDDVINEGMSVGYDMPHGVLDRRAELSPGDIVNTYKK